MNLNPLYHWSPAERFDNIRFQGLRPGSEPTVASGPLEYICLGTTPALGWRISGAMEYVSEIEHWDLWQVDLPDNAELWIRGDFGPTVSEIKCRTPIPAERLWWVGRRYDLGVPPCSSPSK